MLNYIINLTWRQTLHVFLRSNFYFITNKLLQKSNFDEIGMPKQLTFLYVTVYLFLDYLTVAL